MNKCYFTPVPSRRISENGRVEFRLAASDCDKAVITAIVNEKEIPAGNVDLLPDCGLVKFYPETKGITGKFTWKINHCYLTFKNNPQVDI